MRRAFAAGRRLVCGWLGHWPDVWEPRCLHCHVRLADTDEHPTILRRLLGWRSTRASAASAHEP